MARFVLRLHIVDAQHLLACQVTPRGKGSRPAKYITKLQRVKKLLPSIPRPILREPYFLLGCRRDPTKDIPKKEAAKCFKK
jgi:hypothetical protein